MGSENRANDCGYAIADTPLRIRQGGSQEYDLHQLDPATHQSLLIERTLAYGNRTELRWLFDTYGTDQITTWVQRLGDRRLPWRRYNLWCVLLDLPPARRLRLEDQRLWPH